MTMTAHTPTTRHVTEERRSALVATIAILGVIAAVIGAWIQFWTEAGTLSVFGLEWNVSNLSDLWAPWLMIGGGMVTGASMGIESVHDYDNTTDRWVVGMEMLLTLAGAIALVVGVIVLF